jgi:hypothetical protein
MQFPGDLRVCALVEDTRAHRLALVGWQRLQQLKRGCGGQFLDALDPLIGHQDRRHPERPPHLVVCPSASLRLVQLRPLEIRDKG